MKKINRKITVITISALALMVSACNDAVTQPNQTQLNVGVDQADSRTDHENIALSYGQEAAELLKKAEKHERLASQYERTDNSKMVFGADAARHCRSIAKKYREAAAENTELAKLHRKQAEKY